MSYREDWFEAEQLHRASEAGDVNEMARLVGIGFDVNQYDDMSQTPLHSAVLGRQVEAAKWLLEHGANINANEEQKIGETPLCEAVKCGFPELVELLLKHGANPDIPGWMGHTARLRAERRTDEAGKQICEILNKSRRNNSAQ